MGRKIDSSKIRKKSKVLSVEHRWMQKTPNKFETLLTENNTTSCEQLLYQDVIKIWIKSDATVEDMNIVFTKFLMKP